MLAFVDFLSKYLAGQTCRCKLLFMWTCFATKGRQTSGKCAV